MPRFRLSWSIHGSTCLFMSWSFTALPLPSLPPGLPACALQDMKQAMEQEVTLLAAQLAVLQRQRDDALAECSFAREEARVAAASQERALAAAAAAQRQLQSERDAVMQSLSELQVGLGERQGGFRELQVWGKRQVPSWTAAPLLANDDDSSSSRATCLGIQSIVWFTFTMHALQAAFNAAEAKRTAEMQRLWQAAHNRKQEAEALRARLDQQQTSQQAVAQGQAGKEQQHSAGTAAALAPDLAGQPQVAAGRPAVHPTSREAAPRPIDADMENDVVLQHSVESCYSAGSSTATSEPLPLQPAPRNVVAMQPRAVQPKQRAQKGPNQQSQLAPASEEAGWGADYLQRFQVGVSLPSCLPACLHVFLLVHPPVCLPCLAAYS